MELAQLRIFLAVAEHGGFRRAAAWLYLSQPAVSRHVADLERSLGVPLFRREKGRIWLTPVGERFAERAQAILNDCEEAVREAQAEPFTGHLRVGVTPGGVGELAGPILRHLRRTLPRVQVDAIDVPVMQWSDVPPADLDLILVRSPVRPEAARSTVVLDEPMVLTGSGFDLPDESITLAEACELPMVRFAPGTPRRLLDFWSLTFARNGVAADFRGDGAYDVQAMARGVARGLGVAVASPSLCLDYGGSLPTWTIRDGPRVQGLATSRIEDRRPLIEQAHRQIGHLVTRIGPLMLPDAAGAS